MTPLAILEATGACPRSEDPGNGAIPPGAYRAAIIRTEETAMPRRPRVRPAPPRAARLAKGRKTRRPLPERMAERMVECHRLYGRCLERDLHRAGFSPAELAQHGAEAAAIAASRAPELEVPA